jgi:hypothetical protein
LEAAVWSGSCIKTLAERESTEWKHGFNETKERGKEKYQKGRIRR